MLWLRLSIQESCPIMWSRIEWDGEEVKTEEKMTAVLYASILEDGLCPSAKWPRKGPES